MKTARSAIFAIAFAIVIAPAPAQAHAALVQSTPQAGTKLNSAPGTVVLRFSEPINVRLSRAEVADPSGRSFAHASATDGQMSVQLRSNAPGIYVVRWKTVSPLDGHTLRGSFEFGVGVVPKAMDESASPGPRGLDLPIGAARAVQYGGLLTAVGMLLMIALAERTPRLEWASRPKLWVPLALGLAGGAISTIGEALVAAGGPSIADVTGYLTTGLPGIARLVLVGAETVGLLAALRGSRRVLDSLAVAFPALAASGHAAAVRPEWWGIGVDTVHLVSAGLWAGSIVAFAVSRPPGGYRSPEGRDLLQRFTPVAIPAFLVTVATGSLRAAQELGAPSDLWSSSYGRVLSLKLAAIAVMIPLSLLAWRRIAGSLRVEAVLVGVAFVAAAGLAIYPLPPGRAEGAEDVEEPSTRVDDALPRPDDLTLGGDVGEVLVGLTIRPGEPGPNDVLVFVRATGDAPPARDIRVGLRLRGRPITLRECGSTCRTSRMSLRGGEQLMVQVTTQKRGTATFRVPELPAPNVSSESLKEVTARMLDLDTFRIDETLGPGPPVVTEYAFAAPDRMRVESSSGYRLRAIGRSQYQRHRRSEDWTKLGPLPPLKVPYVTWQGMKAIARREIGSRRIDGVATREVTFFTGDADGPIWFRLWVDTDRLVRRMEMRALGHVMDQRFFAFDEDVEIEPPVG